jgi:hypothetical protein
MFTLLSLGLLLQAGPQTAPALPAPFTAARFREHVAYLASDDLAGRDVASEGGLKAVDYLVRQLKACGASGLVPGGEWVQPFPFATRVKASSRSSLAADGVVLELGRDFAPAPRSPDGPLAGELVFVGYGVSAPESGYDDFAGVNLKGKIAVALWSLSKPLAEAGLQAHGDLDHKWTQCELQGASALLVLGPLQTEWELGGHAQMHKTPCILISSKTLDRLLPAREGQADPVAAAEAALVQGNKPTPQSRPLNRKVEGVVQLQRSVINGRNMVAVVAGKGDLAREAVIVSAHHDHLGTDPALIKTGKDGIFNGADDNASGCAAVLLLAEALHADRDRLPASRRTVIIASFDAEERGLVGSRYYVNHPLWPLERTCANLNFDMVGRLGRGRLSAMDSLSNPFLAERITALATDCGLRVETRLGGARRGDNASFLEREIPAVHFNTGLHADYHQVSDEVSRIDAEGGARVSWLGYRVLRETMTTPSRLRYTRPPPQFDVERLIRLVVRLGIMPELNTQPGRYPLIRTVFPGSIAARNGLKSGDEITGINGTQLQGLEDAGVAFAQIRLKDGVRLAIRRAGKTVDLTLPAEAFKEFTGPELLPVGNELFEVHFRFKPPAKTTSVALAGTFNDWSKSAQPLEGPDKQGFYATKLRLKRGSYEYKFVIDGKTWAADPTNFYTIGEYGNSLLTVGDAP